MGEGRYRPGRRAELILGVAIGILLGIAVVAGFVFFGSEDTIDAPRVTAPENRSPAPAGPDAARP